MYLVQKEGIGAERIATNCEVGAGDMGGEEDGFEKSEDQAIFDIKNAIEELEAAFAELEKAQGHETGADFGDEEDGEDRLGAGIPYRWRQGDEFPRGSRYRRICRGDALMLLRCLCRARVLPEFVVDLERAILL